MDLTPVGIILLVSTLVGVMSGIALTVLLLKSAPHPVSGLARSDRFGVASIAGGALLVGVIALGNALAATITALTPGPTTVFGMVRATPPLDAALISLPNLEYAVSPTVDVTLIDAPASVSAWLLSAELLPVILVLAVCSSAVWLSVGLMRGRPFSRRFPVALVVVASAVMICGIGSQLAAAIARAETAIILNAASPQFEPVFAMFEIMLDLSPFGWGLLLGLITGAFQIGTRMQRDNEGLV